LSAFPEIDALAQGALEEGMIYARQANRDKSDLAASLEAAASLTKSARSRAEAEDSLRQTRDRVVVLKALAAAKADPAKIDKWAVMGPLNQDGWEAAAKAAREVLAQ